MRLREHDDDPEAAPTDEERRAASALRRSLGGAEGNDGGTASQSPAAGGTADDAAKAEPEPGGETAEAPSPPASNEARWLAAHLRYPTAEDSIGEVKARRLARMARETVQQRRVRSSQRSSSWVRIGRSLSSTAGLLAAAGLLLLISWLILDQGDPRRQARFDGARGTARMARMTQPSPRVATALLLRRSLKNKESPAQRLDMMIQGRLSELRGSSPEPLPGGRGLATAALPVWEGTGGGALRGERGAP